MALLLCGMDLSCQRKNAPPVIERPAGAGTGEIVARVHLRGGQHAQVKAATGIEFPPLIDMGLLRTDELAVPAGEFLVLRLANEYLVRIDEDLVMKVGDILLLGAPPPKESLTAQLDRLVTHEERVQAERLAGTQARRQAGEEMPALEEQPERFVKLSLPTKKEAEPAPAAPAPAAMEERKETPAPKEAASTKAQDEARRAQIRRTIASQGVLKLLGSQGESGRAADVLGGTAAALRPELSELPELRACLNREFGRLPLHLTRITLRLKVEGGKITRVVVGGALPTPGCAREILLSMALETPPGSWRTIEVPLDGR